MGKKLIIKGANFSQNAIDTTFNPLDWFVDAIDNVSRGIPIGNAVAPASLLTGNKSSTGMFSPDSSQGMLYYGTLASSSTKPKFSTKTMVSLETLYNNGYRYLKLTPKLERTIVVVYSDTPSQSSINPCASGLSWNTSTEQVTIPISANTYILFQARSLSEDPSITSGTITDWLIIGFD